MAEKVTALDLDKILPVAPYNPMSPAPSVDHSNDLVEREARSLAAQLGRLCHVLSVQEFHQLHLEVDGIFDRLLLAGQDD